MPYVVRMEPGNQHGQQYGTDPSSAWSSPPPPAPYAAPPAAPAAPAAPRARIGLVLLTALIVELLAIGGGANQWISDKIVRDRSGGLRSQLIENSWLTFTWRFAPRDGRDQTQAWAAQMLLVLCVLVLSAALIWALLRGPVTWGRAFFGTWLAVLGATVVGAIVRGLVSPYAEFAMRGTDRVTRALYSGVGLNQPAVVGALALGFVVALITSIVAVASRRPATGSYGAPVDHGPPAFPDYGPPAAAVAGSPPPWQDQHYGPPAGSPAREPEPAPMSLRKDDAQPTTQLPVTGDDGAGDQPTTQLAPPPREPGGAAGDHPTTQLAPPQREPAGPAQPPPPPPPPQPAAPAGDQATTRFPRPPDDEELGHIEH